MMRTIMLGSCVLVQGQFVKALRDGRIVIRVDDRIYTGRPVAQTKAA